MSLKDLEEFDEEEEIQMPKKRKRKLFKIPKKVKVGVLLLLIGVIIGVVIGIFVVEPIINEFEVNACTQCVGTKDILTKENNCLYNYINDAQIVVAGPSMVKIDPKT